MGRNRFWFLHIVIFFVLFCFSSPLNASDFFPDFYFVYEVEEGDVLINIARKFGVSVSGLQWANGIEGDHICPGDELIIPQKLIKEIPSFDARISPNSEKDLSLDRRSLAVYIRPELPEVDIPRDQIISYQVRRGDTLHELAREFNTSISVLQVLNELDEPEIRIGDRIYLPIHNLTPRQAVERTISPEEKNLLARVISAEAGGEPFIGQVAVGAVVINRVLSPAFPDNIQGVVYQPGQFCVVRDGSVNRPPSSSAIEAAREALAGQDPTRGALYFYNPDTATNVSWTARREITVIISNHVFAR